MTDETETPLARIDFEAKPDTVRMVITIGDTKLRLVLPVVDAVQMLRELREEINEAKRLAKRAARKAAKGAV